MKENRDNNNKIHLLVLVYLSKTRKKPEGNGNEMKKSYLFK